MNLYFSNNAKIKIFPRILRTSNVKESLISFCRKMGQIQVVSIGITVIKAVKDKNDFFCHHTLSYLPTLPVFPGVS